MKIKWQLGVILITVSIVLSSAISIILYYSVKENILHQINAHLESISETKKIMIENMIQRKQEMAHLLSGSYFIVSNLEHYIRDPKTDYQVSISLPLKRYREYMPDLRKLHILDLKGCVVGSSDSAYVGKDYSATEAVRKTIERSTPFLCGFFYNEAGELDTHIASPVYSKDSMIGVMLIEASAADFISCTNDYTGLGRTGETYIGKKAEETVFITPVRFDRNAALKRMLPFSDTSYAMNKALYGQEGLLTQARDYRGVEVIASTRYIKETGWGIVTEIDKEEAYDPIMKVRNKMICVNIAAIAVTLTVSFILSGFLAKPIEELNASANRLAEGDLGSRIHVTQRNEIGILGNSFNMMAEKLEKNMKEIKQSNESLNKFAYVISHDLKSPLNSIIAISDIIRNDYYRQLDPEIITWIEMQKTKAEEMSELINGVLHTAQKGYKESSKEKVDLNYLIKRVIGNLHIPGHIQVKYPENLPVVHHHKIPLMQVFQNLIGNAVKYNDKKEGWVHVTFHEHDSHYVFSVRDNGPGIKKEKYDKIFRMFESASNHESVESSGIGLSIVKKIIEENGGKLWFESKVNEGTVFYFTIPR